MFLPGVPLVRWLAIIARIPTLTDTDTKYRDFGVSPGMDTNHTEFGVSPATDTNHTEFEVSPATDTESPGVRGQ